MQKKHGVPKAFILKLDTVITGILAIKKNPFAVTFSQTSTVDLRQMFYNEDDKQPCNRIPVKKFL